MPVLLATGVFHGLHKRIGPFMNKQARYVLVKRHVNPSWSFSFCVFLHEKRREELAVDRKARNRG